MPGKLLRFAVAVAVVAVFWLLVLPWAAARPRMAEHLQWLDEEGIDPAAMYYTELDMMQPIFTRLALEQRTQGDDK